jgi:hypothetical protein
LSVHTNGYANALVVKTGPGKLYGFTAYSSNAAAQFILVFDATAVPANGTAPAVVFTVAGTSNLGVSWADVGRTFNTGCVLANSSTGPTLTIGAADCWFDAQFL